MEMWRAAQNVGPGSLTFAEEEERRERGEGGVMG